jgi:hypothetical protein
MNRREEKEEKSKESYSATLATLNAAMQHREAERRHKEHKLLIDRKARGFGGAEEDDGYSYTGWRDFI